VYVNSVCFADCCVPVTHILFPPSVKFKVKFISLELLYNIVRHCWCFKTLSIKVNVVAVDIGMQMAPNVCISAKISQKYSAITVFGFLYLYLTQVRPQILLCEKNITISFLNNTISQSVNFSFFCLIFSL
jgi:hypothetical protein